MKWQKGYPELCSFSNLSVTSPTSQFILQPFHRFTYVTALSPTLPLLHLRHSSFSNPSFASPTSQAIHLRHLGIRPWSKGKDIPLQSMKGHGDARVHIYTATSLGRGRVASSTLGRLYPREKIPALILKEAESTPGPSWIRRSKEKSPPLRHPISNQGRPARKKGLAI